MDTLLGLLATPLLLAIPLAYLWLQVRTIRRWAGKWRLAACLPVLGWAIWLVGFVHDVVRDPTSHNLFPFEILIGVGLSIIYLGALAIGRWLAVALRR